MKTNVSIYVSQENAPLFERAKELLGEESLSATITEAVRRMVDQEETRREGYEEQVLETGTWYGNGSANTQKFRFVGKVIASHTAYFGSTSDGTDRGETATLYLSPKGKFVLYSDVWSRWEKESSSASIEVYQSLEEISDTHPALYSKAREALGEGPIELDV